MQLSFKLLLICYNKFWLYKNTKKNIKLFHGHYQSVNSLIRLGQHSVRSELGLCLQRLTADNKIFRCQAKTSRKKEVWAWSKGKIIGKG